MCMRLVSTVVARTLLNWYDPKQYRPCISTYFPCRFPGTRGNSNFVSVLYHFQKPNVSQGFNTHTNQESILKPC